MADFKSSKSERLRFGLGFAGIPRIGQKNRDIHVAERTALATRQSSEKISENDLQVGTEVFRRQRQALFDVGG
jgi:hypothetical protein